MSAYKDERYENEVIWRFRKWVLTPSGKRVRVRGTPAINTKAAAEAAERAAIDRVLHPERVLAAEAATTESEVPTLEEFKDRFMAEYLPLQKPTSRKAKEDILRQALVPFFGKMRLDEIDQSHVNAFVATCAHLAPKTINGKLTVLSTLLRYAGPKGCKLIPESSLSCHVDEAKPEMHALPASDVAKLLAATSDYRYAVAILLASEAGLRIGEIRGLQWTDVKDGRLTVRRAFDQRNHLGSPKHGKVRSVALSPSLAAALDELPRRGIWVVARLDDGGALGYHGMLEVLNETYVRAGVEVPKNERGVKMPWHALRHAFGSACAARGVPITVLRTMMGHDDIDTTMRYVTTTIEQTDAAILRAFGSGPLADHRAAASL